MSDEGQGNVAVSSESRIAGIWKRLFAFSIDSLILGFVGYLLVYLIPEPLARLGLWGRSVGFLISLAYFGIGDSALTKGRTVGKLAMDIRVIGANGDPLPVIKSGLRFVAFGVPFFLNGAPFKIDREWFALAVGVFLSVCVVGGYLSILYMLTFNRKTRQSLHDYLVGSFVVQAEGVGAPPASQLWKGHVAVVACLFAIATAAPFLLNELSSAAPFEQMLVVRRAIQSLPAIRYVSLSSGTSKFASTQAGTKTTNYFSANVILKGEVENRAALAECLFGMIFNRYPDVWTKDVVIISVSEGIDIGIASNWDVKKFQVFQSQFGPRPDSALPECQPQRTS